MDDGLLAFQILPKGSREFMRETLKGCEKEITLGKTVCSKITLAKDHFEKIFIRDFNRQDHERVEEDLDDNLHRNNRKKK